MKITVLTDNHTYIDQYLLGEPGLCFYLEDGEHRILFDTGYSDVFLHNAKKLGIDLTQVTEIVLSHGHNDHTRGLSYLMKDEAFRGKKLICHPAAFGEKKDGDEAIGMGVSQEAITDFFQYQPARSACKVSDHITFLGEIPQKTLFETRKDIGLKFFTDNWIPDYVEEDSGLVLQTESGIFVISGCAHSGICNMILRAKELSDAERILGVLGGFHLFQPGSRVDATIDFFEKEQVEECYPCHCVSLKVKANMYHKLKVHEVGSGMVLNI